MCLIKKSQLHPASTQDRFANQIGRWEATEESRREIKKRIPGSKHKMVSSNRGMVGHRNRGGPIIVKFCREIFIYRGYCNNPICLSEGKKRIAQAVSVWVAVKRLCRIPFVISNDKIRHQFW